MSDIPTMPTGDIMDSDWYPVIPEIPDTLLDYPAYFLDLIIYVFRFIAFVIRALVLGIGNIVTSTVEFLGEIGNTLSFLPTEIVLFITLSIIALVVIKILRRGD